MRSQRSAILASVATGVVLELGIAAMSGRREAWDSGLYWTIGLTAALVVSAGLGYLTGRRGWYWTGLIVPSQVTAMMVRNGELGGLWPLAVILTSVLGAPFLLVAFVASRFAGPAEGSGTLPVGGRRRGDL
jgi:hypothetical protein